MTFAWYVIQCSTSGIWTSAEIQPVILDLHIKQFNSWVKFRGGLSSHTSSRDSHTSVNSSLTSKQGSLTWASASHQIFTASTLYTLAYNFAFRPMGGRSGTLRPFCDILSTQNMFHSNCIVLCRQASARGWPTHPLDQPVMRDTQPPWWSSELNLQYQYVSNAILAVI